MESNLEFFRDRLCRNVKRNEDYIAEKANKSHSLEQRPARPHTHREMNIRIVRATGRGQNAKEFDPSQGASTAKDTVAAHRWLDSVDEYARLLADFWSKTSRISVEELVGDTPNLITDDVVIALIDDGVDVLAPEVSGKIIGGRSFDDGNPYYISQFGHGTIMASMIMRVCPMAKLYPIRLRSISSDGGRHIDVKSAVAVSAHLCNPRL
jgi:subtilisin family serine protease